MNKIKTINIITFALQVISTFLLFGNDVYSVADRDWGGDYHYYRSSFYNRFTTDHAGNILGVAFLALVAITATILIIQLVKKSAYILTPFVALIQPTLFIMHHFLFNNIKWEIKYYAGGTKFYKPSTYFYIIIGAFALIVILSFVNSIIQKKVKKEASETTSKDTNEAAIAETSNVDELKKYKDLLDSGVITQEEFDTKKKQLLGL